MNKKRFITQKTAPYLFCAPFIISFFVFLLYPMITMVQTSFKKLEGVGSYRFVGMQNYVRLLGDRHIGSAVWTSIWFTIGIIILNVTLPLLLAVILAAVFGIVLIARREHSPGDPEHMPEGGEERKDLENPEGGEAD